MLLMFPKFTYIIPFIALCLVASAVHAQTVSGIVTDESGNPLPFANVFIRGTTHGTTTNSEGKYALGINPGPTELVFKFIGFKTEIKSLDKVYPENILNVVLLKESYSLREVVVTAGEDPAYAIMRNAIAKRKFYHDQVEAYSCKAYIKGQQRLLKWPKKILGQEVLVEQFLDTVTKIIYLSESVSEFSFSKPDRFREEMISSKVSGSNKAFSWNQASDMQFDFYENLIRTEVTPRGVVSPIAANAMFYYRYLLEGSYEESGVTVHKIKVIPKRNYDPVFRGTIYIQDSAWRIHAADLYLTRDAQLQLVDTLTIHQVFIPVISDSTVWLPATSRFTFHFSVLGFEGNGNYTGIFSDYNLSTSGEIQYRSGEIMKVNEDANKKDFAYWDSVRPVPLTHDEMRDYVFKDSIRVLRESKPYLDSIDRKNNRLNPSKILLTGYTYHQRYKKQELEISPLIRNIQFNTVEGLNFSISADYTKRIEKDFQRKRLSITPFVKYGVRDESFHATLRTEYFYDRIKLSAVWIEGGKNSVQYNPADPIAPIINTSYTLLDEKNYMKIFEKKYGAAGFKTEIINGINASVSAEYSDRSPLVNHSRYKWIDRKDRDFFSNNPLNPIDDSPAFAGNQSFSSEIAFRFSIRQTYISRPDRKYIIGSEYPELHLRIRSAFTIAGSDVRYDVAEAAVTDEMNFGLIGKFRYEIRYGKFLNRSKMFFMDFQHFNGNRTIFSNFNLRKFNLLDYYSSSTNHEFFELHAEHQFNGFLFNKIPGLRKLQLSETAGFHLLHVPGLPVHYEISAGIGKLNLIRVEIAAAFAKNQSTETALRISLAVF